MKKFLLIILIFQLSFLSLKSQEIIQLKNYYKGFGVIFDETFFNKSSFTDRNYLTFYRPELNYIIEAEKLIQTDYYRYKVDLNNYFGYKDIKTNPKLKKSNYIKRKFNKYYRQYYGYIDKKNDTIIVIQLLNFRHKKKSEKLFKQWDSKPIFGSGDWFYKNQYLLFINLSKDFILLNVAGE